MLNKRLLIAIIMIPILTIFAIVGGWVFSLLVSILLGIAAWEYWRMFKKGGFNPSRLFLIISAVSIALAQHLWNFAHSDIIITLLTLISMSIHTFNFQKGINTAAVDFSITTGGFFYIGWLGSYLISIRNHLPDGFWWLFLVLPAVALADSGAYLVGSQIGKHKIMSRVSPKKSWEGYFGGVVFSVLGTAILAALIHTKVPQITFQTGIIIGLFESILTPLGDFGISMIKRQFNIKDTSKILPGHGGILDRIDSWLWAGPIGYYLITLFFI